MQTAAMSAPVSGRRIMSLSDWRCFTDDTPAPFSVPGLAAWTAMDLTSLLEFLLLTDAGLRARHHGVDVLGADDRRTRQKRLLRQVDGPLDVGTERRDGQVPLHVRLLVD